MTDAQIQEVSNHILKTLDPEGLEVDDASNGGLDVTVHFACGVASLNWLNGIFTPRKSYYQKEMNTQEIADELNQK